MEDTATIRQLKSTVARTLALKIKRENGPEHISWYVVLLCCAFVLRSYCVLTAFLLRSYCVFTGCHVFSILKILGIQVNFFIRNRLLSNLVLDSQKFKKLLVLQGKELRIFGQIIHCTTPT